MAEKKNLFKNMAWKPKSVWNSFSEQAESRFQPDNLTGHAKQHWLDIPAKTTMGTQTGNRWEDWTDKQELLH